MAAVICRQKYVTVIACRAWRQGSISRGFVVKAVVTELSITLRVTLGHRATLRTRWGSRSRIRFSPTALPSKRRTHISVSVTSDLVPVEVQWCSEARKVTAGLASHWTCVTDFAPTYSKAYYMENRSRFSLRYVTSPPVDAVAHGFWQRPGVGALSCRYDNELFTAHAQLSD